MHHIAKGIFEGKEVYASIHDLEAFINANENERVLVSDEEGYIELMKCNIAWTLIEPIR